MSVGADGVRTPAVAGAFYPANPMQLRTAVERFLVRTLPPVVSTAVIVPHAGYVYSGATAGKTYACVDLPHRLFVLCPNHTGLGSPVSTAAGGRWRTPLGDVAVDGALAAALVRALPEVEDDPLAHRREHAIEVQLPFLQVLLGDFTFVPVVVGTVSPGRLEALGNTLAEVVSAYEDAVAIVVSSDMNHYEDAGTNREKDEAALDAVLHIDPAGLYRVVHERQISMC